MLHKDFISDAKESASLPNDFAESLRETFFQEAFLLGGLCDIVVVSATMDNVSIDPIES